MQADLDVTHSGITVCGWLELARNGDRSACLTIDCYPLAQLNATLHLYDKQLNLIQALVFCCPSVPTHLGVLLHYPSSLYPC